LFEEIALQFYHNVSGLSSRAGASLWGHFYSRTVARVLLPVGLGLALIGLAGTAAPAEEHGNDAKDAAGAVLVTAAKKGCFSALVRVNGLLMPAQQAVVTFELSGYRITDVKVREGDRVAEKDELVKLVRVAQAAPGQQEKPEKGQQGQQAQGQPETIILRAPMGGRIEKSTARVGDITAAREDPLFRIASDDVELEADVPSIYLGEMAIKQVVRISSKSGEVIGQIKRISPEVDKTTQLGHIRAIVGPDPALRAGSFVRATIEAGESCGVSVPRSAVNYGTDGTTILVVRAQTVEARRVKIGLTSDQDAEIREGVKIGEVVVAHAGSSLRTGDQVTIKFIDDSTEKH
jgi:multidrug efflux pump subunit AcrA (membrane-fusion protein)